MSAFSHKNFTPSFSVVCSLPNASFMFYRRIRVVIMYSFGMSAFVAMLSVPFDKFV